MSLSDWQQLGVYTPDQAARLLRMQAASVQRWLYGSHFGEQALLPQYPSHAGKLLTFIDFVQTMAIKDIRDQKRVSLQKIRQTIEFAKRKGVLFPFALRHKAYVFRDEVVLRLNDGRIIGATGKYREQDLMEPIVAEYMHDLGYDDRGFANSYTPLKRGFRQISLSPMINYGAPMVIPCGYTVETLLNAYDAEGSIEAGARICDVNEQDIQLAIDYESTLKRAA